MAKTNYFNADNLARVGLLLVFAALALLQGAVFGDASTAYFWMALIILLFETFKLPSVSVASAAIAQTILSATMVVGGVSGLINFKAKSFVSYHAYLIILILGALLICFAAYKRLNSANKK